MYEFGSNFLSLQKFYLCVEYYENYHQLSYLICETASRCWNFRTK